MAGFFYKSEQATIPLRFVFLTMHFVMALTIWFDRAFLADRLVANQDLYNGAESLLNYMGIACIACFAIEFVSIFIGGTLFKRGQMLFSIVFHAVGFALAIAFHQGSWNIDSYIAITTICIFFPAAVEVLSTASSIFFDYTRFY
ncbi:hypothetical protein FOA52_003870 [Chlamydomonas sp. UWO 241]|nr:hypothetical protein FOA52_003870 [Chlamydomonas sp. UWO 241]